jgi:hypothetical protein
MPRLFITPREIHLINDWTKELYKDVVGQQIFYYAISTNKTRVHDVYDEAIQKFFEKPITLPVLAGQPEWSNASNAFGVEQTATIELFIQARDLIDKKLSLSEGDFFTYGDATFEVVSYLPMNNIFGHEEYEVSYKIIGNLARPGQFDPILLRKPTKDGGKPFGENGEQTEFVQQRGLAEDSSGPTGDVRQLRERLGDEMVPTALGDEPAKVEENEDGKASSFQQDLKPSTSFYS